ncbi:mechanosensitive ion channel family protein [Dermabacteraceae bacterium TAE3-ERU27]|nr:mechanosensitive ion channel family protein [Dermabacteraceae bacterium TAE3-ERU27]
MPFTPFLPCKPESPEREAAHFVESFTAWLGQHGVNIVVILLGALVIRLFAGWMIRRGFHSMMASGETLRSVTTLVGTRKVADERERQMAQARRKQRADTISQVLRHVVSATIVILAFVMILAEIGINIAPIIAGLGVAGVAAGVGAQTLVKDLVAGAMILCEDLIGVGDVVDLEYASGTVENINLRVTQVRGIDGVLWTVRNGEIIRIGNKSRGFASALVVVDIAAGADDDAVREALSAVCDSLPNDPDYGRHVLEAPVISGILSSDGARYQRRIGVKVAPGTQWDVEQEVRRRVREEFRARGIEMALPRFQEAQR